jgi:non-ribosomal peptide synthetase component F
VAQTKRHIKKTNGSLAMARPQIIGLMVDHGPNLLVGLLGILKSGNGFLPLDPLLPIERLDLLLSDSDVEIVMTEGRHLEKVILLSERGRSLKHIICLDQPSCQVEKRSAAKVYFYSRVAEMSRLEKDRSIGPGQTVYLIYTSGSTGAPKGVCISHRNLIPLLIWSKEYFRIDEQARVLQNLPCYFDFGLFEILTTLLFGGTLYFLDKREVGDPSHYADFIYQNSINIIHSTPSLFNGL